MKIQNFEKDISIDEYLTNFVDYKYSLTKCSSCPNFNTTWSCPPFDFDPIEKIKKYDRIHFFFHKMEPEGEEDFFKSYRNQALDLNVKILEKEKEKPESKALIAGSCKYCGNGDSCMRKKGKPCIHPDKCRHSVESMGGLVDKIAKDLFDVDIKWSTDGSAPSYLILMQALLYKNQ